MAKQKIVVGQFEIARILADGEPDIVVSFDDPDWEFGPVAGYLWETLEQRIKEPGDISSHISALVRRRLIKFLTVRPRWYQRLVGKRARDYCYLTPLGREAARNPSSLLEARERDDYDRRYEPRGMWLRQFEGLPPNSD